MRGVKSKQKRRRVATRKIATNLGGSERNGRTCADITELTSKARECQRPKQAINLPTKQGKNYVVGKNKPPLDKQFGQPNGNPRHSGAWRKEDTLRYKLEKLINGLDDAELEEVLNDPKTSPGVRRLATLLYKSNYEKPESEWRVWEGAMNQAYGLPKQAIEQTNIEAPVPLSPRSAPVEPGLRAEGAATGNERDSASRSQTAARNTSARIAKSAPARLRTAHKVRKAQDGAVEADA